MRCKSFFILLLLFSALQCLAHSVIKEGDQYVVSHNWGFRRHIWNCTVKVPVDLYQYYQSRFHMSDDMVQFVLSDYDRTCIKRLGESFRKGGATIDYTDEDLMNNVICFVQSLPYVTDKESKGVQDYVRFPLETLVDGEGDCEDKTILAAAILHEMGFDVLLAVLPDHLALAVKCDDNLDGIYYTFHGKKYYYFETTNPGWRIGQIPDDFRDKEATLVPLVYQPRMRLKQCRFRHDSYKLSVNKVPFTVSCELENAGPGTTSGLSIHLYFKSGKKKPVIDRVFPLTEMTEGTSSTFDQEVLVPRPFYGKLEINVEGKNFNTLTTVFDNIELK